MKHLCLLVCMACMSWSHAQITFKPCTESGTGGNGSLQAECAVWQQPLDRSDTNSDSLELFVVKLASTALHPAKDAFTIINGGPGGSSVNMLVDLAGAFTAITRERDVIVIDQRGTGRSSPLTCPGITDEVDAPDTQKIIELTKACLSELPFDPRYFSTTVAVNDLEALRATLGYDQLTIYGVSYGTRVAMQYMRMFPNATRAVIIDGVVPPSQVLGGQIAMHSQNALDSVFKRCAADSNCAENFPTLREDFNQLAQRLKQDPPRLHLQHPVTGEPSELELTYGHLSVWIRFSLYAIETTALIPLIIHQAVHENNYLPIAANSLRMLHDITTALNYGMHNAVVCTEDSPFFSTQPVDLNALDETYLGRGFYETIQTMCSVWPAGVIDAHMKKSLTSDIPTLVLSGELDPITPPAWGMAVMPGLSNAKHVIAPGQGHGTIGRGCIPKLVLDFVESADVASVDDTCTQHLAPYPFFINLMGPSP